VEAAEKKSVWRLCGGYGEEECVEGEEQNVARRRVCNICLLGKKKSFTQLGQRFFCWGCRESDSFYCFIGVRFGGAEGVWFWGAEGMR